MSHFISMKKNMGNTYIYFKNYNNLVNTDQSVVLRYSLVKMIFVSRSIYLLKVIFIHQYLIRCKALNLFVRIKFRK